MIPVEILNNKGELIGQQAFNDNLTTVEQINRVMVQTLFYAQQKLTNDKNALDKIIMAGEYTAEKLDAYKAAADALYKSVSDAVVAFEAAIAE